MSLLSKLNPINWVAQKAALTVIRAGNNQLFRALYQFMGQELPVMTVDVAEMYIKQGYAGNDDVFSIVNYIATKVAALPWKLYTMQADGTMKEIKNHPLLNLIDKPNPFQTKTEFIKLEVAYKLVTGNTYQYAIRPENGNNAGRARELHVMPAHLTEIVFGNAYDPIGGYNINGYYNDPLPATDVLHRKEINLSVQSASDLYGMSRLRAGAILVGGSTAGRESNARAIKNQGPPGILSGGATEDSLTLDQAQAVKREYLEKHTGHNSHVPIITGANLKWQAMGYPSADLELIDSMEWTFNKLCNLYMLNSNVLNGKEGTTFNNQSEAKKSAYEDCILPEAYALRDSWNNWLTPMFGDNLWLDIDTSGIDVLQENKKEQTEWLRQAFWIKGIDKQRMMGVAEDPAMDKYFDANGMLISLEPPQPEMDAAVDANAKNEVEDY